MKHGCYCAQRKGYKRGENNANEKKEKERHQCSVHYYLITKRAKETINLPHTDNTLWTDKPIRTWDDELVSSVIESSSINCKAQGKPAPIHKCVTISDHNHACLILSASCRAGPIFSWYHIQRSAVIKVFSKSRYITLIQPITCRLYTLPGPFAYPINMHMMITHTNSCSKSGSFFYICIY